MIDKILTYLAFFAFMYFILCCIFSIVGIIFILLFKDLFDQIGQQFIDKIK